MRKTLVIAAAMLASTTAQASHQPDTCQIFLEPQFGGWYPAYWADPMRIPNTWRYPTGPTFRWSQDHTEGQLSFSSTTTEVTVVRCETSTNGVAQLKIYEPDPSGDMLRASCSVTVKCQPGGGGGW